MHAARALCQQNARDYIQYSTSYAICVPCGCHLLTQHNRENARMSPDQTLSHLWVGSGDEASWPVVSFPDPTHATNGKGSGDIHAFFLVVLCQQSCDNHTARIWHKTYCTVCSLVRSADTAQPRKRSNVTRPFPICGWGLGTRLAGRPQGG